MAGKKRRIALLTVTGLLVLLILAGIALVGVFAARGIGVTVGRYLQCESGIAMLIDDGTPITMSDRSGGDLFAGLSTGDEILVVHDGVMESYPAQTGAYLVIRLGGGSMADIPQALIGSLTEFGYLKEPNEVCYSYDGAGMALQLPSGWAWERVEFSAEARSFGIRFWPEESPEGALYVACYPDGFGVCGTGLHQEKITLANGLEGWQGTYNGHKVWDFISFRGLDTDYVVKTENAEIWWDTHGSQAMDILHTLRLGESN